MVLSCTVGYGGGFAVGLDVAGLVLGGCGGIGSIGQLDAYYRLNKAKTYDEWYGILSRGQIPSTNFIYGDAEGNIAYVYNAAIPERQAGPDWRTVLPGDDSALIW